MKREVSLEDISDGKLYGLNDLVKADCHDCEGCFDCCCGMGESIILDPYDVWRLTGALGKSFDQLLLEHLELHVVDGVILPNLRMAGERNCCTFLSEAGRCSIHASRPGICRLFPLGRFYEGDSFRYFLQTNECKRGNRSKIKVKKWIDTPDIRRNERFILDWHDFVAGLQKLLTDQPDMEKAKKLNLYVLEMFFFKGWKADEDFYVQFEERLEEAKNIL
ncbi:MAG: YkgJ family cysteine cluster protein [Eubacteriales bacterium]|nr:YkgJ family cysteine cluster protein [Eubacteriales bacterium]